MTIHAFSSYSPQAGSTRVRLYDWFRHLGVTAQSHTFIGQRDSRGSTLVRHLPAVVRAESRLRLQDVRGSTVIMSREASPLSSGGLERRLLQEADRSVYDFDDALFAEPSRGRRYLGQRDKCKVSVTAADVVIAGNDYLADWATRFSSNVVMVPSCVEPDDYEPKRNWEVGETPVIVWLGSPSTEQFLQALIAPLLTVHALTGARLRLISGPADNPALAPLAGIIDRIPWRPTAYAPALAGSDVAIGPLSDTPFTRGKCAYKLLQYAAASLPMVASPVGANALALQRFDGLPASTPSDWVDALTSILSEPTSRRKSRGEISRASVERHYAFSEWARQWTVATGLEL